MGTIELIVAAIPGILGLGVAAYFGIRAIGIGDALAAEKDRSFKEREVRVEAESARDRMVIDVETVTNENARLKSALAIAERAALAAEAEEVRRVEEDPDRSPAHVGAAVDDLLSTPLLP